MTETTPHLPSLDEVEKAAARMEQARLELHTAIFDARRRGISLRHLADASGMSHETVRSLILSNKT